jgi:chromosome segregation ATPase
MKIGNAEYFENLNKEIKEKQNELSLSNSKVVAMKQMIANRDQEIEDLKKQLETVRALQDFATKEEMILSRKVVEMGYNPSSCSRAGIKGFQSLEDDPLNEELIDIYNDPIWNN